MALLPTAAATSLPTPIPGHDDGTWPSSCPGGTVELVKSTDGDDQETDKAKGDRANGQKSLKVTVTSGWTATVIVVVAKHQNHWKNEWNTYNGSWVGATTVDNLVAPGNNENVDAYLVCGISSGPAVPTTTPTTPASYGTSDTFPEACPSGTKLFGGSLDPGAPLPGNLATTTLPGSGPGGSGALYDSMRYLKLTLDGTKTITAIVTVAYPNLGSPHYSIKYHYYVYPGPLSGAQVVDKLVAPIVDPYWSSGGANQSNGAPTRPGRTRTTTA